MPIRPTVDLHVHSRYSDGTLAPAELAKIAARRNILALAITDHDSLAGVEEKRAACLAQGIECVIGTELSCELEGKETHILSLFADPDSPQAGRLEAFSRFREKRMRLMLERLAGLGIRLNISDLQVGATGVYGRPHLARALVERGIVGSVGEAFARYLYDGGPVHVEKLRLSAAEGIGLAKELGGVAVLAHPGVSNLVEDLEKLVDLGLEGVEAYHPKHGNGLIAGLLDYCRDRKLLVSGGSDYHGPADGTRIGDARVPAFILEPLRE
ncbi:MAG: PHP domain-containing protein, partial [Planctomycetota bacterium]|nr:PHP domain-containing protein [Planctomycetota bacterium]